MFSPRRSTKRVAAKALVALIAALSTLSCTLTPCPVGPGVISAPPQEEVSVLFLIGDAGEPMKGGEPVLRALTRAASEAAAAHGEQNVAIAFLGDIIYPNGLPAPDEWRHEEMARKLDAQIDVARESGVQAYFLPGNHDWWGNKKAGLKRLLALEDYLENAGESALLTPAGACPGPEIFDVGDAIRLIAIDTHWWLRKGVKPQDCATAAGTAFDEELRAALDGAGSRRTVVAAHHPLISGGPHSGKTLFIRAWGITPQDLTHSRYEGLIERLDTIFEDAPPALYAAGHEHSTQLHRGPGYPHVVTGGGNADVLTSVGAVDETVTCSGRTGFARFTVSRSGDMHLSVYTVHPDHTTQEIFGGPPPS